MDALKLTHLLTRTAAMYRTSLTDMEMDVYLDELGPLDEPVVRAAFRRYMDSGRAYFPTVPELLKSVQAIGQVVGTGTPTALDAWGQFRRKVTRLNLDILGSYPEQEAARVGLTPLDGLIARRLGGWAHLGQMSAKDLDWKAKEFAAVYDELAARQRTEDHLLALEPSNRARVPLLAEGE